MFAVLPIFLFLYFSWGVYKWSFFNLQGLSRKFLLSAFILKIIAGLALTYLYTYYYDIREEADTYRYFDDSYHLHRVFFDSPVKYFRILLGIDEGKDLLPYLDAMNNWFPQERNTFYNDNRTVIRINALLRWISFGNYYVHLLFFSTDHRAPYGLLHLSNHPQVVPLFFCLYLDYKSQGFHTFSLYVFY